MKTTADLQLRPFDVHIPNLDADGIAETIQIQVPVQIDQLTGEEILTPEAHELIEKTKARRMGLMSADELRALRERFELTQEELSGLLRIGAKTYTRWESGRARPSRSLNLLLCALRDGALTLEYLRCKRESSDFEVLLHRRIEHSIVFQDSSSRQTVVATFWSKRTQGAAVEWRRLLKSMSKDLAQTRRHRESNGRRGNITHHKSPYAAWSPPEAV